MLAHSSSSRRISGARAFNTQIQIMNIVVILFCCAYLGQTWSFGSLEAQFITIKFFQLKIVNCCGVDCLNTPSQNTLNEQLTQTYFKFACEGESGAIVKWLGGKVVVTVRFESLPVPSVVHLLRVQRILNPINKCIPSWW